MSLWESGLLKNLFQGSETAASLADKVPERIECCIHVIRRMIGADLEADFLIALRHPNVILGALGRHH